MNTQGFISTEKPEPEKVEPAENNIERSINESNAELFGGDE